MQEVEKDFFGMSLAQKNQPSNQSSSAKARLIPDTCSGSLGAKFRNPEWRFGGPTRTRFQVRSSFKGRDCTSFRALASGDFLLIIFQREAPDFATITAAPRLSNSGNRVAERAFQRAFGMAGASVCRHHCAARRACIDTIVHHARTRNIRSTI